MSERSMHLSISPGTRSTGIELHVTQDLSLEGGESMTEVAGYIRGIIASNPGIQEVRIDSSGIGVGLIDGLVADENFTTPIISIYPKLGHKL